MCVRACVSVLSCADPKTGMVSESNEVWYMNHHLAKWRATIDYAPAPSTSESPPAQQQQQQQQPQPESSGPAPAEQQQQQQQVDSYDPYADNSVEVEVEVDEYANDFEE